MMSIKEKLAALQRAPVFAPAYQLSARPLSGLEELGLTRGDSSPGGSWLREKLLTPSQIPIYSIEDFIRLTSQQLVLIGKSWALQEVRPETILFIDTETTGLMGGTGTYAFLVGTARCSPEGVVVKQYFLSDLDAEKELYASLFADSGGISAIISFNGKCYDLPLIRNRCIMNHLEFDWEGVPHLDLLHTVRRLFKGFPSYALGEVESRLVHFRREGDIPGALIPGLYFDAIRSSALATLKPVFQHNTIDLLSLIGITIAAARCFAEQEQNGSVLLAVARTFTDLELYDQAMRVCSDAQKLPADSEWIALASYQARLYKKRQDYSHAVELWEQWIQKAHHFNIEPYEELAKYYEHRSGERDKALQVVEQAQKRLDLLAELQNQPCFSEWDAALRRRKGRLMRKMETNRDWPAQEHQRKARFQSDQ